MNVAVAYQTISTGRFAFFPPGAVVGLVFFLAVMWVVVSVYLKIFTKVKAHSTWLGICFAITFAILLTLGTALGFGVYTPSESAASIGAMAQIDVPATVIILVGSGLFVLSASVL